MKTNKYLAYLILGSSLRPESAVVKSQLLLL